VFLKRDIEIVAESLQTLVTFANPLRPKFADQIGAREFVRENAPANAIASFQNGDIPTGGF